MSVNPVYILVWPGLMAAGESTLCCEHTQPVLIPFFGRGSLLGALEGENGSFFLDPGAKST